MQLNCTPNPFNFDELLKQHLAKGKLEKHFENEYMPRRQITHYASQTHKYPLYKAESQCYSFGETKSALIYVYSSTKTCLKLLGRGLNKQEYQSMVTLYIFQKSNGTYICKALKPISGRVVSINISFSEGSFYILLGTKCGMIQKVQFNNHISVESTQYSYFGIQQIMLSRWRDVCFLLCEDENVQIINYVNKAVIAYLISSYIPLDQPLAINLNSSGDYLLQTSKNGTLKLWRMGEDIVRAVQTRGKTFNIKPSLTFSSIATKGLIWGDFIGHFFAIITKNLYLKILAISVNIMNEAEQNFEHILNYQVGVNGQSINGVENIVKNRCLVVLKNEGQRCWLEMIHYDDNYLISKVGTISITDNSNLLFSNFQLTQDLHFIVLRANTGFLIGYQERIFLNKNTNKIHEESLSLSDTQQF